jgi:hypothetical protein
MKISDMSIRRPVLASMLSLALVLFGAIGYTHEHDLHLWLRRAWALAAGWGDPDWHRERVARTVLGAAPLVITRRAAARGVLIPTYRHLAVRSESVPAGEAA